MSLTLKSIETRTRDLLVATYDLKHSTPGAHGTCLTEEMTLNISPTNTSATLTIPDCEGPTPEDALKRMSAWLRRLADGIDEHKTSINLPL